MQIKHRQRNVVEEGGVISDRSAAAQEDDDLLVLLLHFPQERVEKDEALIGVAHDIALLKTVDGAVLRFLIDVDVQWAGS